MVWYVEFDLVWFRCLDLHRLALVYFGLLCFGLAELGILHTMDHGQTKKRKKEKKVYINGVGYRVAAQLKRHFV